MGSANIKTLNIDKEIPASIFAHISGGNAFFLENMKKLRKKIIVIGAGIGGLTAGALLAKRGYEVTIFDRAAIPGGCASTFQRKGFTFDVGATQVAGLEAGGIHHRIFTELGIALPTATLCNPACAVFLPDEREPINVWSDPEKWAMERQRQFPHSEPFWQLLNTLFRASWQFQARDPVLPPRNLWDLGQLIAALRPDTLITFPFALATVGDALKFFGLYGDRRLKTFLDLQLKLYSQVKADETALLYAATALAVSQEPQGLYHLQGSMQVLSDQLVKGLEEHGGKLYLRHSVEKIQTEAGKVKGVTVKDQKTGKTWQEEADEIVANLTVQNLLDLTENPPKNPFFSFYRQRINKLEIPSGAFVIYLGVEANAIPANCPPHLQFLYDYNGSIGENNSLFVSVSKQGDGRAPEGKATIVASSFTEATQWFVGTPTDYNKLKERYTYEAIDRLLSYFHLTPANILHQEAGTPRTFARYTGRQWGIVGGVGQRISTFGPFGIATRTPIQGLWLVGDSAHPGEGTAGVSYSAWTVTRQIEAS
jgi:C-3',4' desaturase CrtD